MADFNPYLQTPLRDQLAQGANTGDVRNYNGQNFRFSGTSWDPNGGTAGAPSISGSTDWKGIMDNYANQNSNLLNTQKTANDARFAQNRTDLTNFTNDYKTNVNNITTDAYGKYNVPGQLSMVNALNSRIADLTGNLSGAGGGGYSTGAQVDKAINTKYLPRAQQAVTNLNTSAGLAQGEVGIRTKPYETQATLLNDQITREATGYTAENQNELDSLMEQMKTTGTLAAADMARMTQLAINEQNYQLEKYKTDQANKTALSVAAIQDKYKNVAPGSSLFNTQTGKMAYSSPQFTGFNTGSTNKSSIAKGALGY